MSFDSHLIHTCTIERVYQAGTNSHGLSKDRDKVIAEAQVCRLVVKEEKIGRSDSAEAPVVTTYTLLLPANADINQKDKITKVVLEDASELGQKFVVENVLPRRARSLTHVSVKLMKVS